MELLTYRLATLMDQVAENQIAELINKDRLQKKLLMEQAQRQNMRSHQAIAALNQPKKFRRPMLSFKKKEEQKDIPKQDDLTNDEEKTKDPKIATIGSIWGLSKKSKDNINNGGGIDENPKTIDEKPKILAKEEVALSKFRKAGRITALICSIKQGREICTCESLDATCKIHDS